MTVRTVNQREIPKLVSNVAKTTGTSLVSMLKGDHKFFFGNREVQCQPIDALRWFTETIPDSSKTLHIRNIMVNAVNDSESIQGSSAVVCATALSTLLSLPQISVDRELFNDLKLISTLSRRSTSDRLLSIMKNLDRDDKSFSIVSAAILGCSSNAAIQVTKGSKKTNVKRVSGYKFPLTVPEAFVSATSSSVEKVLRSPRTLVIDGFVESVSEIDGVMRSSYESKTPLIIVARGFSPDVINTFGVNFSHGHLCVIPLIVPFDEVGVNQINDIGVILKSDIVSSTKGEIVSARKWEDLGCVEIARVNFSSGTLVVVDESLKSCVMMQRKAIRDLRKRADSESQKDLYDRRLSCLMGEGVVIDLGEDLKDLAGIYTDRLNSHIRNYRSGAKFGSIQISECFPHVKSPTTVKILKQLQTVSDAYTTLSLLVGIKNALTCAKQLGQIGGIIYNDKHR